MTRRILLTSGPVQTSETASLIAVVRFWPPAQFHRNLRPLHIAAQLRKPSFGSLPVHEFEIGDAPTTTANIVAMRCVIEAAGVELIFDETGEGVGTRRK
jgi:hypothetical protein